ncbi:hypothetical protein HYDPIDRAFT_32441 [Hydnomerulius pinastri MD-312]|uniref:Uncharacterized protein n=1 Tax=Hydnomerulius pinastri MD-312 TaxID=994086 RepID=A0A0C9VR20_9AGAM|nr:hypothetical protein HYDPIDRAFT_32441 [Hydnomerulius pinastri MD-312]
MSSITVFGFFGIAAGQRVSSSKPSSFSKTFYCLRVYSPFNDTVLPNTTFNSCQGLTLNSIGVDLTRPVFSHG